MQLQPIKTRTLLPPQDNFINVIDELDLKISEQSVLAISAKAVAIHQGRCVLIPNDTEEAQIKKDELVREEAEYYLERDESVPFPRMFTIYEGTFCSSSGIDESNSNGYWTLLPKNSSVFAEECRSHLMKKHSLHELGVVVIDSRSFPMRNGTIGMALGYAGFKAQYDYRGKTDLFGRPFNAERINVPDCLASAAILAMGEGAESTPLVLMHDIPHVEFTDTDETDDLYLSLKVPMEQDVFAQFYKNHDWKQK